MFYSVETFGNLSVIEITVIGSKITSNPTQSLDVCSVASGTVFFDFALIAASKAGINGEIECEVRDIQRHSVVNNILNSLVVI